METDESLGAVYRPLVAHKAYKISDLTSSAFQELDKEAADLQRQRAAAMLIQQTFLHKEAVFRLFGPAILTRRRGAPSNFGTIHFPEVNTRAKFVVISNHTSEAKLSKFVDKFWRIEKPEVIISVTGSAQDIQLNPILQNAFDKGLTSAAASAGTWIITGGTDTGVMKLVASSLRQSGVQVPLIGVTPYGAVANRHLLDDAQDTHITLPHIAPTPDEASLNSHHTHFILVESKNEMKAAWGNEINTRVALEGFYLKRRNVPMVLLVVQGGPGTLSTVLATAEKNSPIVVVAGSGGAASAIKHFIDKRRELEERHADKDEWPDPMWPTSDGKFEPLSQKFNDQKLVNGITESLQKIYTLNKQSGNKLITMYEVNADGVLSSSEDLSNVLLQAIVRLWVTGGSSRETELDDSLPPTDEGSSPSPRHGSADGSTSRVCSSHGERTHSRRRNRAIQLAVKWDRREVVASLFSEVEGNQKGSDFTPSHQDALQYALELRRASIIELLLSYPGFTLEKVNLCRLFLHDDPYRFLAGDESLQNRLMTSMHLIRTSSRSDRFVVFQETVGKWLEEKVSADLAHAVLHAQKPEFNHLVMWAHFFGEFELADLFWKECDDPARVALLGARQCQLMGQKLLTARAQVEQRAAELESRATDVIDAADSQEEAFRVLEHKVGRYSLLDLALKFQMKRFLAHSHCQALLDRWWRGSHELSAVELPENVSLSSLLGQALIPVANPHYRKRAFQMLKRRKVSESSKDETLRVLTRFANVAHDAAYQSIQEMQHTALAEAREGGATDITPEEGDRIKAGIFSKKQQAQMSTLKTQARPRGVGMDSHGPVDPAVATEHLRGFYQIPSVVFVLRFFMHSLFLVLYTYILSITDTTRLPDAYPEVSLIEVIFMWWSLSIVFDDVANAVDDDQQSTPDGLMILRDLGMIACAAARCETARVHAPAAYSAYHTLLSFNIIFLAFALIEFRSYHRSIGVLYIMIKRMMTDLVIFMEVFLYIVLGFCLAFYGLYIAVHEEDVTTDGVVASTPATHGTAAENYYGDSPGALAQDLHRQLEAIGGRGLRLSPQVGEGLAKVSAFTGPIFNPTSAFMKPFWAVYGAFEVEELATAPFGVAGLMWVYVLISSVILVNLLVAMFSDTYTRVLEQSEEEFRYQRYQRMYIAQNVWEPIPPPLNLPFNVLKVLRFFLRPMRKCCEPSGPRTRALSPRGDGKGTAPPEAKRLQQRYLEKSERDQSSTVDAKTSSVKTSVQELTAQQNQQYILLTEQIKSVAHELKAQRELIHSLLEGKNPLVASTDGTTLASTSALQPLETWDAVRPPPQPVEMPERDNAMVEVQNRSQLSEESPRGSRRRRSFLPSFPSPTFHTPSISGFLGTPRSKTSPIPHAT